MKQKSPRKNKQPAILKNKTFFIFLFLISAFFLVLPFFFDINIRELQSLGLLGIAILNFISASSILLPSPGFIATGIGGSLYNPVFVALASSTGAAFGESVGFIFGHASRKISHPNIHRYLILIERIIHHKHGGWLIVVLAFIPNPFFDIVGITAGVALYSLRKFLMLVFIGRFARDLIVAYVGSLV